MRIRDLTVPLFESVYTTVAVPEYASKTPVGVHKNPNEPELMRIMGEYQTARAFLVRDGILIWGMILHALMYKALDLNKYVIPIMLYTDGKQAEVQVTDFSKNTVWHNNPRTANAIRNNPYLRKMDIVDIDYYNDAMVGDWEDL